MIQEESLEETVCGVMKTLNDINKYKIYANKFKIKDEETKVYVGKTAKPLEERLSEHNSCSGSRWTSQWRKDYPDQKWTSDFSFTQTRLLDEDELTLNYISIYGIKNVRGGVYCQDNLENDSAKCYEINCKIRSMFNLCYTCGKKGHYKNSKNCNGYKPTTKLPETFENKFKELYISYMEGINKKSERCLLPEFTINNINEKVEVTNLIEKVEMQISKEVDVLYNLEKNVLETGKESLLKKYMKEKRKNKRMRKVLNEIISLTGKSVKLPKKNKKIVNENITNINQIDS